MNRLTCEMCGSTDLIKQDGYFICQWCGCKYTVEEARRMMIEGTVDVQGTVKVDNSSYVEKYLANARRAKAKEDWEEAERYYNMVEQNDPTCIEAIFYSAYAKAMGTLIDENKFKREAVFKVLKNCVSIIDDNFSMEKEETEREVVKQISEDILSMVRSGFIYKTERRGDFVYSDANVTYGLFMDLENEWCESLQNIIAKYPEEQKTQTVYLYPLMLAHYEQISKRDHSQAVKDKIDAVHRQWNAVDPSHSLPVEATPEPEPISSINRGIFLAVILATLIIPFVGIIWGGVICHRYSGANDTAERKDGISAIFAGIAILFCWIAYIIVMLSL